MAGSDDALWILIAAILVDCALGEPKALWARVPHPVVSLGTLVSWLDHRLNVPSAPPARQFAAGAGAAAIMLVGGLAVGAVVAGLTRVLPFGAVAEVLLVAVFLAGRSLYDHVAEVATRLAGEGLEGGRDAVRQIVGRDPDDLDEAGISRAAIESLAENFSDGFVAPALWYLALGLPGLVAYKAINTADSMIGYRTPRYRSFGTASARLDDVLNWVPARISGGLIVAAAMVSGRDWRGAIWAMAADARHHKSVNAGWPEAAMAGALGIMLAGPRSYDGKTVDDAAMNGSGRQNLGAEDIWASLKLGCGAASVMLTVILVAAFLR